MVTVTALRILEDFERRRKGELLRGELIEFPPSFQRHSKTSGLFFRALDRAMERLRLEWPELAIGVARCETECPLSSSTA